MTQNMDISDINKAVTGLLLENHKNKQTAGPDSQYHIGYHNAIIDVMWALAGLQKEGEQHVH